jgi:5'-nucleotidase
VSNDDGVGAPGIDSLVQALRAEPNVEVTVVAPADNKSGSGSSTSSGATATNATTLSGFPATAVNGFPADAVNYGLDSVVKDKPDVVITGTNQGQNIGPFVDVSGTVGAARAAAQRGIPALAVSAGLGDPVDFAAATKQAIEWLREHRDALLAGGPAPTTVDNLNAPTCSAGEVRGLAEVPADPTAPNDQALAKVDCTSTVAQPSTDVAAFNAGFATLSHVPLTPATG